MAVEKPPLGATPRWLHEEEQDVTRIKELAEAIIRYREMGLPCPPEWGQEILQLSLKSREGIPK